MTFDWTIIQVLYAQVVYHFHHYIYVIFLKTCLRCSFSFVCVNVQPTHPIVSILPIHARYIQFLVLRTNRLFFFGFLLPILTTIIIHGVCRCRKMEF